MKILAISTAAIAAIVIGCTQCDGAAPLFGCSPPFGNLGPLQPEGTAQPFDSFETITICSRAAADGLPFKGVQCEVTVGDDFSSTSWGCPAGPCGSYGTFSDLTRSELPGQPPSYQICATYQNRSALPGTAYLNLITGRIPY